RAILASPGAARRLVLQLSPVVAARLAAALPAARPGIFGMPWPKPGERAAVESLVARVRRAAGFSAQRGREAAGADDDTPGRTSETAERATGDAEMSPGESEPESADDAVDAIIA